MMYVLMCLNCVCYSLHSWWWWWCFVMWYCVWLWFSWFLPCFKASFGVVFDLSFGLHLGLIVKLSKENCHESGLHCMNMIIALHYVYVLIGFVMWTVMVWSLMNPWLEGLFWVTFGVLSWHVWMHCIMLMFFLHCYS